MSLIISPQDDAKQRIAKKMERTLRRKDPSAIMLGSAFQRSGDLTERVYDDEVEYDVSKFPKLQKEAEEFEDRARNAKRFTTELLDEAQKQFEKTKAAFAKYQWQGQERWQGHEQEEARKVNVIHCREFVRKLAKVGVRVWLNDFTKLGRIGVNANVPSISGKLESETVTTLQYPWSYEWSIMRFNEYNVPTLEKFRGWRTTLLMLILGHACTEAQAHQAFGAPSNTMASEFYLQTLQNFREKKGMFRPSLDMVAQAAIAEGNKKRRSEKQCKSKWKGYRCQLPVRHRGFHEQSENNEVLAAWSKGKGKEY